MATKRPSEFSKKRDPKTGALLEENLIMPQVIKNNTEQVDKIPNPLPKGYIPDPTNKNQMIKPGTPTETRATPEYANLAKAQARAAGDVPLPPENQAEVMAAQKQTQERNQIILEQAKKGLLTSQELQEVTGSKMDIGQTVGAGLTATVPGVIGGAVTGATVGALGGPVGAIGGAVVGGIGAFLVGIRSSIKSQQTGEFAADQTALSKGQTMLRSLITDTNQNPQNAPENIALFYQTLNMIDAAHEKTWKDSQEDLNKFLGNDGTAQLAKFDTFDAAMRQYYINRFETALMQPNPGDILISNEDMEGFDLE